MSQADTETPPLLFAMSLMVSQLVTLRRAWISWKPLSLRAVFNEWAKQMIVSDASGSTDDSNLHYFVEGTFQDDSESTDDSGSTDDIPRVDVGSLWDLHLFDYMHLVDLGQYHAPHVHLDL